MAVPLAEQLPVVVVGAGLAGLTAAAALAGEGRPVIVVEGAPAVGGRLATRPLGHGLADLGAQFFTTRSPAFAAFVAGLEAAGVVREWCRGFNEVDGYPRYVGCGGMSALAAHLAGGLDVRAGVAVDAVAPRAAGGWEVRLGDGVALAAAAVVLTPPVPVSLGLLAAGSARLDPAVGDGLRQLRYHAVLAVAAELDRPPAIPAPGGRQLAEGPFSFVADNAAKGLSPVPCVTLHASHEASAAHAARAEGDPAAVLGDLLHAARPWLGDARVVRAELHAWAWSGPVEPWPERYASPADGVVLAGDAFGGPKVEGAWLSGRAAGLACAGRAAAAAPATEPAGRP